MLEIPTLVIVDVQKAFDDPAWGNRNNPRRGRECRAAARSLARRGRADHACATFDREGPDGEVFPADLSHRTNLASLHNEFAEVVSTDEAIARLDSSSDKETSSWAMP